MREQLIISLLREWSSNRPGELAPIIRRKGDEIELVELHWGLKPRGPEHRPIINIRSEGRRFPSNRCLVPATEFFLSRRSAVGRTRWRFTMADGDSFYFAGLWRPAFEDWPESYAVLTTEANPDVAPYNDRQMAVICREDRNTWLDLTLPEEELLRPLPAGSFRVQRAR
jgi:putative SOS response-associated peptidase YedK